MAGRSVRVVELSQDERTVADEVRRLAPGLAERLAAVLRPREGVRRREQRNDDEHCHEHNVEHERAARTRHKAAEAAI